MVGGGESDVRRSLGHVLLKAGTGSSSVGGLGRKLVGPLKLGIG